MTKIPARSLMTICINIATASLCVPAFADTPTTAPTTTTAPSATKHKSSSGASFPVRVAGVIVGTLVGTPVCVVRKSIDEQKYAVQGMVGDTNSKLKRLVAGAIWLPLGIATGTVESPICAAVNSLRENDKPFSKSQFAISDIKKDNPGDGAPKEDAPQDNPTAR
jgi:hypothetical protein